MGSCSSLAGMCRRFTLGCSKTGIMLFQHSMAALWTWMITVAKLQRLDRGHNVRGRLQQILNSHQRVRALPICLGKRHATLSSRECRNWWGSTESKQKVQLVAIACSCSSRCSCFKAPDLRLANFFNFFLSIFYIQHLTEEITVTNESFGDSSNCRKWGRACRL